MIIGFGTWTSALDEAALVISKQDLTSDATGYLYGYEEQWTITGVLQAAATLLLQPLIAALEIGFSRNNQPAVLATNTGVVLRSLPALTPLGGTRVVSGPEYPDSGENSAEYTTYRRYRVVIAARIPYPQVPADALLSFHESLSFHGSGGPRFVFRQPLNGFPQKQLVADATVCRVRQRGSAVGLGAYPPVPLPLWPEAEKEDERRIDYQNPRKYGGPQGDIYVEYPVEWEYSFESVEPLFGLPNVAIGV